MQKKAFYCYWLLLLGLLSTVATAKQVAVELNQQIWFQYEDAQQETGLPSSIILPALDGQLYTAKRIRVAYRAPQQFSWVGEITQVDGGMLYLVVDQQNVTAHIDLVSKQYEVHPDVNGRLVLSEVSVIPSDTAALAPTLDTVSDASAAAQPTLQAMSLGAAASAETIDVMVVYTAKAAQQYTDIENRIQIGIEQLNQSFLNSGIAHQVTLVHTQQVDYDEDNITGGLYEHVRNLAESSDGRLDAIHPLRQQVNADIVSLWLALDSVAQDGNCGYAMDILGNASTAFTAVKVACASANYTFAHEVGHLFGAMHKSDSSQYPYPYGHGSSSPTNQWRSIMTYPNACNNCDRIPYFSTPLLQYQGEVLGNAATQDNVRVINQTGAFVNQHSETVAQFTEASTVSVIDSQGNVIADLTQTGYGQWQDYVQLTGDSAYGIQIDGVNYGGFATPFSDTDGDHYHDRKGQLETSQPWIEFSSSGLSYYYLVSINTLGKSYQFENVYYGKINNQLLLDGVTYQMVPVRKNITMAAVDLQANQGFYIKSFVQQYGDNEPDGTLDLNGAAIRPPEGAGHYRVFIDPLGKYRMVKSASSAGWQRTVVFIYGQTQGGQDMFIRGGLDHGYANSVLGRNCQVSNFECAIPIQHNNGLNATTAPWKAGDEYLDWYGFEAAQSSQAQGTPLDWTTDVWPASWGTERTVAVDGYGVTPLNTFGQHYWMLDVQMDCSKTVNGWFELKSYISNGPGWEGDVSQPGAPYASGNHFAECGKLNVFRRGESNPVTITDLN